MTSQICGAINEKKIIEFNYDGGRRTVEPHCCGLTTAGHTCLRAFQVKGFSLSGGIPDWRLFDLSKAMDIIVLEVKFSGPRPGYTKGDKAMMQIYSEL